MPVILITDDEKLKWEHEETQSGLYYKRPTSAVQRNLTAKHTKNGELDTALYLDDMLDWAVTGWWGFQDATGQDVAFSKDKIPGIPETYKAEFVSALFMMNPVVDELGN